MTTKFQAKHLILVAIGVLIVAIIGISMASAFMLREKEIETWRHQVANMSLVMEEQTSQTMSSANIAMDSIAERIVAMNIRNEAELRSRTKTEAMFQIMRDKITGLTQVDVATIVASNGDVINFTRSFPAPAINLSDRDYFIAQRDTPALGLFISTPVQNKANGKWVFYLSRRLNDVSGKFMGLVLIGISVDQFINYYERLGKNLGEGAAITLYRNDFTVLARWPLKDKTVGEKNITGTTHRVVEDLKKAEEVIYTSGPRFSDSGALVARMGAVRVLDRFPMILNLTVTEEFFLANWRHTVSWITSVAAGSSLALVIMMIFLLRVARQREQTAALLSDLADQVPGMLYQFQLSPDGRGSFLYVNQIGLAMHGLKAEMLPVDAATLFGQIHPEDRERIRASIMNSARNLQPWQEDYRLLLPDNEVAWRHGNSRPQKLEDGTIIWHGYIADITERKQSEEVLRLSEERLSSAELTSKSGNWEFHLDSQLMIASKGAARIYGKSEGQYELAVVQNAPLPEYRSLLDLALKGLIEQNQPYDVEFKIRTTDTGEIKDIHSMATYDRVERVVFGVIQDITSRKQAEEQQRLAATVFSHAREGILITNANGTILDVNATFSQLTGFSREEAIGKNPRLLSSGDHEKTFYTTMWHELIEKGHWSGEITNRRKNGEIFSEMLTISAVHDLQGKTQQYVALFSDITESKKHERQLEHMAHYDLLTLLPNRVLLADRLQQAMSQAVRRRRNVAVCYLDLDGFKEVNDRYGHDIGDQLLIALASKMKQALRGSDTLARIGGDEFVAVLLDQEDGDKSSLITVERLIHTAAQPVQLGELVVQVSASLGITFYPQQEAVDADQLLRQADNAMYQAKVAGKNRYQIFRASVEQN